MKITFSISYDGKTYDTINDAVTVAIENGMRNLITEKLEPFKDRLQDSEIRVKAQDQTWKKFDISIHDVPDDIRQQVQDALYQ